ncbi:hypothetical protein GW17_00041338 [Ensete ventricosum]|nr:hypothetical protein GW17_00041338 [Ensete ventricosum]
MVIYKFGYGDSRESKILTCVLKVRHQVNDFSELRRRTRFLRKGKTKEKEAKRLSTPSGPPAPPPPPVEDGGEQTGPRRSRPINCELLLREPYFIRRNPVPGREIDRWIRILFLRLVSEISRKIWFHSRGCGSLRKWFSGRRSDSGEASELLRLQFWAILR